MSVKRYTLFHCPRTRSTRVKWLLHELFDEDFDVQKLDLYAGEGYAAEFLERNPNHNVPVLEMLGDDGSIVTMLESGAMLSMLADAHPESGLAPAPNEASPARAQYLHMLHFATTSMDMMLWQIRCQTHLLHESERDPKTCERYRKKFVREVEPQLRRRLSATAHIAGDNFTAADCAMGHTIGWAQAYGMCEGKVFVSYMERLGQRRAFQQAFADAHELTLAPPRVFRGFPG